MRRGLKPGDFQEGRREPRVSCSTIVDLLPCQARGAWKFTSAEVTDCSLSGIGLIVNEPIEVNQQFMIKLKLPTGVRVLIYTVHNCDHWERSRYRIGAKFSGFAAQAFDEDPASVMEAIVKGR